MLFVALAYCLPVLLDVERPLELQVHVLVVVGEHGRGLVVAAAQHTSGCGFGLDWEMLLDDWYVEGEDETTYTSSRIRACRWCLVSKSPVVEVSKLSIHDLFVSEAVTYNHLLHLLLDAHPRHDLHILHAAEDVVLDAEASLHAESGALLNGKGLLVEGLEGTGLGQIDDDVGAAFDFEAERDQDDFAVVVGVGDGLAATEAERLFPLAEGLIVLVCEDGV